MLFDRTKRCLWTLVGDDGRVDTQECFYLMHLFFWFDGHSCGQKLLQDWCLERSELIDANYIGWENPCNSKASPVKEYGDENWASPREWELNKDSWNGEMYPLINERRMKAMSMSMPWSQSGKIRWEVSKVTLQGRSIRDRQGHQLPLYVIDQAGAWTALWIRNVVRV